MKVLLTGATGYIGKRLLPALLENGHDIICCVRDRARFNLPDGWQDQIQVIEVDFTDINTLDVLPREIDIAYYLIHSMSGNIEYAAVEEKCAYNFMQAASQTKLQQVIYLGGMTNDELLSKHLQSRKKVGEILGQGSYALTTLKAGIIIGSGSASFEIIRDLVEKLPIMVAPKWLLTKCQPIGISNVIEFLIGVMAQPKFFNKSYDIGGADILTYREMLLQFARLRGLRRRILIVPVMTPRLSSYWLYFITSTSYRLATALVDSMKVEVVGQPNDLANSLQIKLLNYRQAIERAFKRIEENAVVSSWKDALNSDEKDTRLSQYIEVPTHGCLIDCRRRKCADVPSTLDRLWAIGGTTGWYYADGLWRLRGFLDKLMGGVGLRRGRTHPTEIYPGNALDFWRVLWADKKEGRLLLFAEMKLPGEAWLEFNIGEDGTLIQRATFRPKGLLGRLYWYCLVPLHHIVFRGMLVKLTS